MDFLTNAVFSLTVGIAGVIGLVRFRKVDPAYHPFLFLVWAALFEELCSIGILYAGYSNVILYNAFSLAEALLLCWQFWRWKVYRNKMFYVGLQVVFVLFWAFEWFGQPPAGFLSYFIVFYSFAVVLLSITCINQLLFRDMIPLFRNPVFLLCVCFILYYSFSALVEVFWMTGLQRSKVFRLHIHALLCYINLLTNLIFALAILWIPLRLRYILQC
jgi:hypothetical protein